jgi:phytoene dehydrogenase-like protein
MMTAQMDALIEAAQAGFIPDGGTSLGAVLEAFPEFFRLLTEKLHELGEYIPGMGMSEEAGALISDMAVHCGAAQESASSAALVNLAQFLNGG